MFNFIAYLTLVTLTLHVQQTNNKGGQWLAGCTAVYVSPNTALTAAHCFGPKFTGKAWVKNSDGASFPAELLYRNKSQDLALISVHAPDHAYAHLGTVDKGDHVYTLNSGNGMIGNYMEGQVSNVIIDTDLNDTPMILHTAPIKSGASGSGLFNRWGHLVGINTISMGNLSEAVDTTPIRHFLELSFQHMKLPHST